jgi:hypothetical protein
VARHGVAAARNDGARARIRFAAAPPREVPGYGQSCQQGFPVAAGGTYGPVLAAEVAAIRYTLQATAQ